jgi:sugar transferase (PEP-CTERM/EpsH1 system associated)
VIQNFKSELIVVKKILHLIYCFDIGGLEKVMTDTINHLPEFEHVVISLTYATEQSRQNFNRDVVIHELHKMPGNDLSVWKKLFSLFDSLNADVLHTYNLPTLEYQLLASLCRIPIRIHAEHGRDISDPAGKSTKYRILRKLLNPFIHQWVPVSKDLSHWLEHDIGINKRKIHLIKNGIDCDFFKPNNQKERSAELKKFASKEDIVIGTVGRLDPVKNQKVLIELFQELAIIAPELAKKLKIAIIGDGPLYKELKSTIIKCQLEQVIWLPGARYYIVELISSFDVFILPSIAEGIPMTVLEAMAIGKPVIASNVGGLPEIIINSTGVLVSPDNKEALTQSVLNLLKSKTKMEVMGRNARQHIKNNFSIENMINHYQKLYQG